MSETLTINSALSLHRALRKISDQWDDSKYLEIQISQKAGELTKLQNKSLHLFCKQLADALNAAGFDMMAVLKHDAEIPWTKDSVKEHLWRPIQKAMTDKQSTQDITTVEPTAIHETLCRHLGSKLGIQCPAWPSRERKAA